MRDSILLAVVLTVVSVIPAEAASYRELFQTADPAVVVLSTLERNVEPRSRSGEVTLPGLGSGVLIDKEGHIMTAAHVVQTADLVEAEFADGSRSPAMVVASDPDKDVALLKLDRLPATIKPAKLGDSDQMGVGDEIFIIGAPLGLAHTLTVGHISARHEQGDNEMSGVQAETFQTDAAINKGNSGGPMFNQRGEVVGIVSYILSRSGGSDGLGFAVTSNAAVTALYEQRMAWTGMSGIPVRGRLAAALNVPQQAGYLIQKVAANSPASRLGLRPSKIVANIGGRDLLIGGDIILALDGLEIAPDMMKEFREKAPARQPGAEVPLKILRAGQILELNVPVDP